MMVDNIKAIKPMYKQLSFYTVLLLLLIPALLIFRIQFIAIYEDMTLFAPSDFWGNLMSNFPVPVALVGASAAFIGFKAFLYRSALAEAQLTLTYTHLLQNEDTFTVTKHREVLKLYLEHKQYVYEELIKLRENHKFIPRISKRKFYDIFYPENFERNFNSLADSYEQKAFVALINNFQADLCRDTKKISQKLESDGVDKVFPEFEKALSSICKTYIETGTARFGIYLEIKESSFKFEKDISEVNEFLLSLNNFFEDVLDIVDAGVEIDNTSEFKEVFTPLGNEYFEFKALEEAQLAEIDGEFGLYAT